MTTIDNPSRIGPGDLLAAVGELDCAQAAQLYAACGLAVLPLYEPRPGTGCSCPAGQGCRDAGKHPRITGGVHAATSDAATVRGWWRRWPTANLATRTGLRFDVCDLDGPAGAEALRAALSIAPPEHPGPVARTGAGGWHLLFHPTGLGNRVGLAPGVDWRGSGGYVVLAPSRHRSGGRYAWTRPLGGELPAVPAALQRLLAPPQVERATRPPAGPTGRRAGGYAAVALERERAQVAAAQPGWRNATLNRAAFNLGQLAAAGLLDADRVRVVLLAAALAAGNPEGKARATIESGLRGGAAKPRVGRVGGAA
jgi:hypothetical protein